MQPRQPPTHHEIERYAGLFAERTQTMTSSIMRDLMAITARPEVISLAGGLPDTSTFPKTEFTRLMERISDTSLAQALQYGPTEGFDPAKLCVAEVMAEEDTYIDPDDVLITTGGQQAIDLVAKTFVDPGDPIICEAPTYPGAVPVFTSYQADVHHVEMDGDGLMIDRLEEVLRTLEAEGKRPKFIYTVPNFHNPAGVSMSLERRRRLVEIAAERELMVVEDNPYGLLRFDGDPLPTLLSLEGGRYVLYIGTFSKILSPGIRLGWLVAPVPVHRKANLGKQAADLCTSSLTQYMVMSYFKDGGWRDYVRTLTNLYRRRRDVMLKALEDFFPPESRWTTPGGGMFVWVRLPDFVDTQDLLVKALKRNVAFVPGSGAYVGGIDGHSSMRLNFSGVEEKDIREGVRRIGSAIDEQIALYSTITGRTSVPAPGKD